MLVMPCTNALFRSGTKSLAMMLDVVISPPPPSPANNRAAISVFIVGATAQSIVPTKKKNWASRLAFRRPRMSARRP